MDIRLCPASVLVSEMYCGDCSDRKSGEQQPEELLKRAPGSRFLDWETDSS
jgi:hypothetical protein